MVNFPIIIIVIILQSSQREIENCALTSYLLSLIKHCKYDSY